MEGNVLKVILRNEYRYFQKWHVVSTDCLDCLLLITFGLLKAKNYTKFMIYIHIISSV